MTEQEFQGQMNRLVETFGANHYKSERMKLLWREVKDFSGLWFEKTVDQLIGSQRQPPMITEFRESIAAERERIWKIDKGKNAEDARKFSETFPLEEIGLICEMIRQRIKGQVSDENFNQSVKLMESAAAVGGRR